MHTTYTISMRRDTSKNNKSSLSRLVAYIVDNNPNGVRKLAYQFGYPNFSSREGALKFLSVFLKEEGEKGFDALILQHPDKDVVLEVFNSQYPKKIEIGNGLQTSSYSDYTSTDDAILSQIAHYIVSNKATVLALLADYSSSVPSADDLHGISAKVISLFNTNAGFRDRLRDAINDSDSSTFIPQMITAVAGLGTSVIGIAGAKGQRQEAATQRLSDMTMAMMGNKQKQADDKSKKTKMIIGVSAGLAGLVILGLIAFFVLRSKK